MYTLTATKMNKGISTAKANRLFWMGRYAERVYLALHLLRKHYDLMIDQDSDAYKNFCTKIGIENNYLSGEDFMQHYLYDETNPDSIINMLERVNDNAILIREEIMSESLSYVQMSISFMKKCKEEGKNLVEIQKITDYMLAFWGSIEERISNTDIRHTIKFGKFVESADLHIRFEYTYPRVNQIFGRIMETIEKDSYICDEIKLLALTNQMNPDRYNEPKTLFYLNGLFTA